MGALVAKKAIGSDSEDANILLLPVLLFLEGTVKLIDCKESRNVYISELSPEALAWKSIN